MKYREIIRPGKYKRDKKCTWWPGSSKRPQYVWNLKGSSENQWLKAFTEVCMYDSCKWFCTCMSVRPSVWLSVIFIFIHSGYFYSASSSPLLLRGALDTARILCRNFTPKRHRQLWAKDLPKVSVWRLEQESNPDHSDERRRLNQCGTHAPKCVFHFMSVTNWTVE